MWLYANVKPALSVKSSKSGKQQRSLVYMAGAVMPTICARQMDLGIPTAAADPVMATVVVGISCDVRCWC